jgi:hypothetical protein
MALEQLLWKSCVICMRCSQDLFSNSPIGNIADRRKQEQALSSRSINSSSGFRPSVLLERSADEYARATEEAFIMSLNVDYLECGLCPR